MGQRKQFSICQIVLFSEKLAFSILLIELSCLATSTFI